MSDRHHIVRNLIINYLKLCNQSNGYFKMSEIRSEINRLLPKSGNSHIKFFDTISRVKSQRAHNFPKNTGKWTKEFLVEFQRKITMEWSDAIPIHFVRHFKTNLNDGTYLGQGRDPDIDTFPDFNMINGTFTKLYSSPLRRCIQSANVIAKSMKIMKDDRLLEFDYGKAEGLSYDHLANKYPDVTNGWKNGEDPKFPGGENTEDVSMRLKSFMFSLSQSINKKQSGPILIVTHNGVLRCLLGKAFGLNLNDWYKLAIPHGIPLEFFYWRNRFFPNISRKLLGDIFQKIGSTFS